MKALLTIKRAAQPEDDGPEEKATGGLVVVEDETDKKADAKAWTLGTLCAAIANDDILVRPFRTLGEPGYFNVGKALGQEAVGSLYAAKAARMKAITGMSESVPADGGLLVGTTQNMSILERMYNVGSLLSRVDMLPIGPNSNGMTFVANAETSRKDGSRAGGVQYYWGAEGVVKDASSPTFRALELKLNKIFALVYATDELLQDATALEAYILSKMPQELMFGVEDSIIRGTGAGQPEGILTSGSLVTVAAEPAQAATTLVSQNIINMWARRYVGGRDYVWLVNQDVTPQLHQLNLGVGAGGQLTYMPPGGLSGSSYGSIYARPVIELEYSATLGAVGDIILAAFSEYQMIEKGAVQQASSIHVAFLTDQTVFRFVYRVDGESKWNLPLTPYQGANTVSPFVTLAARP